MCVCFSAGGVDFGGSLARQSNSHAMFHYVLGEHLALSHAPAPPICTVAIRVKRP